MRVKITIVRELCIGAGTCLIHAPKTFELDQENIAVLKDGEVDTAMAIVEAAKSCPTLAIILHDLDTGKQLWPVVKED